MDPDFCEICNKILSPPYMRCAQCEHFEFCLDCFSKGFEKNNHLNCHDYIIIKKDFPLFECSGWNFHEELQLLDAILDRGFGNWEGIARKVQTKSAEQCRKHYIFNYIENNFGGFFPLATSQKYRKLSLMKYALKMRNSEEPPRYQPNTQAFASLAGYNSARGDFEYEFDNNAESILSQLNLNFTTDDKNLEDLHTNLQLAIVDSYNRRLKERIRRKLIIRNHGLIIARKVICSLRRYCSTIPKHKAEGMLRFMQISKGEQFDFIMEGLHHFGEIKQYIINLKNYRKQGLKYLGGCRIFNQLENFNLKYFRERKHYINNCNWHNFVECKFFDKSGKCIPSRKPAPPLQIINLPGYEKLSNQERELCSSARIVPQSYIEFKNILIKEYKKNGFLKLAQARTMIRIDVNKTRKIYDFLINQGYITS